MSENRFKYGFEDIPIPGFCLLFSVLKHENVPF
jgi:hypothetical protein